MTIKITALLTSVSAVVLYALSLWLPNDPYFYFVSGSMVIGIGRLIVAVILVTLVFRSKFIYKGSHWLAGGVGALLIIFGLAGLVVPWLDYSLYNFIKPLDFIYFLGAGTIFISAAIGYARGTHPLPQLNRPRLHQLGLPRRRPA